MPRTDPTSRALRERQGPKRQPEPLPGAWREARLPEVAVRGGHGDQRAPHPLPEGSGNCGSGTPGAGRPRPPSAPVPAPPAASPQPPPRTFATLGIRCFPAAVDAILPPLRASSAPSPLTSRSVVAGVTAARPDAAAWRRVGDS